MDKATQNLLLKAALLFAGGYVVYQYVLKPLAQVPQALTNAAQAIGADIGGAAADFLHTVDPNSPLYEVQFPDGTHHLVDSATVTTHWFSPDTFILPAVAWAIAAGWANKQFDLKTYAPGSYYAVLSA